MNTFNHSTIDLINTLKKGETLHQIGCFAAGFAALLAAVAGVAPPRPRLRPSPTLQPVTEDVRPGTCPIDGA